MSDDGRWSLDAIGAAVDRRLAGFLGEQLAHLSGADPVLEPLGDAVARLIGAGGKRIRPAFVYWGHRAAGAAHDEAVLTPAAAVELVHAFALIHDDVMDHAPTRRGRAAAHEAFAATHAEAAMSGDSRWFGVSAAILAGDVATAWAARLFDESAFAADALARARDVFTRLQVEVISGQYMEMWLAGRDATETEVLKVALLKSGRYTVTRPLHLGAALGGGGEDLGATLTAYGDAVGLGFQLRDDVLGLFGDPSVTGKGNLEDVRGGKRTLLVVWALQRAGGADRRAVLSRLGNRDVTGEDVEVVRGVVTRTGALADVEALAARQRAVAAEALEGVPSPAREALSELADLALDRTT